jgi:Mor family transcriptional regulator
MNDRYTKLLEYIDIEELPEHYQNVAEIIGAEAMLKLAVAFPGVPLYFKHPDRILFTAKKKKVLKEFTGANHRRLALDTGLPLATVYEIIKGDRETKGWKQEGLL